MLIDSASCFFFRRRAQLNIDVLTCVVRAVWLRDHFIYSLIWITRNDYDKKKHAATPPWRFLATLSWRLKLSRSVACCLLLPSKKQPSIYSEHLGVHSWSDISQGRCQDHTFLTQMRCEVLTSQHRDIVWLFRSSLWHNTFDKSLCFWFWRSETFFAPWLRI